MSISSVTFSVVQKSAIFNEIAIATLYLYIKHVESFTAFCSSPDVCAWVLNEEEKNVMLDNEDTMFFYDPGKTNRLERLSFSSTGFNVLH